MGAVDAAGSEADFARLFQQVYQSEPALFMFASGPKARLEREILVPQQRTLPKHIAGAGRFALVRRRLGGNCGS